MAQVPGISMGEPVWPAGAGADQVRTWSSYDRAGARPGRAGDVARPRRRGDQI